MSALPGVGWSSCGRLAEMGIETVAQLRLASPAALQASFGAKTAQELLRFANGQDDRQVCPLLLPQPALMAWPHCRHCTCTCAACTTLRTSSSLRVMAGS